MRHIEPSEQFPRVQLTVQYTIGFQPIDVRVLSATQMDLEAQIEVGLFRRELYAFVGPQRLVIPPLRERPEDILPLARSFLQRLGSEELTPEDEARLLQHTNGIRKIVSIQNDVYITSIAHDGFINLCHPQLDRISANHGVGDAGSVECLRNPS